MIDSVSINRKEYAKSKEELAEKTVKMLRSIAPKVGISNIDRNGQKVRIADARKDELIEVIYKACEPYRELKIQPEVANKAENNADEDANYSRIEETYNAIAEKYYNGVFKDGNWEVLGLKPYQTQCLAEGVAFKPDFQVMVSFLSAEIKRTIIERVGEIKPNTAHNYRSEISKRIEALVERDSDQFPENVFQQTFKMFYGSLKAAFSEYSTERRKQQNINLNNRQNSAIEIECHRLIDWAKGRLVNLPVESARYTEVAIAIAVLTGRRQSEVMSSAKFTPTDSDSHLTFAGQLKKHRSEVSEAYEIPVLANGANAVLAGIKWLESRGKREVPQDETLESQREAAKQAHNRFSRYLSSETKKIIDRYVTLPKGVKWDLDGKDRKKFHLFRQIYAQVAVQKFFPTHGEGRKLKQILTEIMGHSDLESSKKSAAESYDSDIWVIDVNKIP